VSEGSGLCFFRKAPSNTTANWRRPGLSNDQNVVKIGYLRFFLDLSEDDLNVQGVMRGTNEDSSQQQQ
jgi:hypothetical protein